MTSMRIISSACLVFAVTVFAHSAPSPTRPEQTVRLGDLPLYETTQGWGALGIDTNAMGGPLQIGSKVYHFGFGTHAAAKMVYRLSGSFTRFQSFVGVDASMKAYTQSSIEFQVIGDGKMLYQSGVMRIDTPAKRIDIPVKGVDQLQLIVSDAGDGNACDHADWAEPTLIGHPPALSGNGQPKYTVSSPQISIQLTQSGTIAGVRLKGGPLQQGFSGAMTLEGLHATGTVKAKKLKGGGMEFRKSLDRKTTLVERFLPTASSIRWEVAITSKDKPWTTPVNTTLRWPNAEKDRMWVTWGGGDTWQDPMVTKPFERRILRYGELSFGDDGVSLPIITVIDSKRDMGFSLVQSPRDTVLDGRLQTWKDGRICFSRIYNRLGEGKTVRFTVDLVAQEGDIRSGLAWLVKRYPEYFEPVNPLAHLIGGGGAYTGYEGDLDAARLRKMGFTFNWKASIDFPYMGMFLPPVGLDARWNRFAGGGPGYYTAADEGRFGTTSIRQLADYSQRMRKMGFFVLNYFNVTEFGGNIEHPAPPIISQVDSEMWKAPNDYLYGKLASGILRDPVKPIGTWGGAIVTDVGDPVYQRFMLDQAKRHIVELPYSSGICIDRMDWIAKYNPNASDGVTWNDGPQRSLVTSWNQAMAKMGPMMHQAGKVIFGNPHYRRLDLMKEIDGIYDEAGAQGFPLNTSSFMALRKPMVAWTTSRDPGDNYDAYFQRHLYMGSFVTCPLPQNDHTITPSLKADEMFLMYGPLFNTLRGRKWVLLPHVVTVVGGGAKANVFEVPGGYVVPVVFGSVGAKIEIRGLGKGLRAVVLNPGAETWKPVATTWVKGVLRLIVLLSRGCAMVRLNRGN